MLKLGYGAGAIADYPWHLDGTKPWQVSDTDSAIECLAALKEMNINFIDTAHRYGSGQSENIIGSAVSNELVDDNCLIFTKIELGPIAFMARDLMVSRDRLKGKIDGILIHNPDFSQKGPILLAARWMEMLGIKYFGISTEPTLEAKVYYDISKMNAIEFPYSIRDTRAEEEIFPWIRSDVFTVVNRVFGGPKNGRLMDSLTVNTAIRFVCRRKEDIDIALVGTTRLDHLKECSELVREITLEASQS